MLFRVIVAGSRDFNDYAFLESKLNALFINHQPTTIISGGARGADALGHMYANQHNIPCQVFNANWDEYGKRAGFIRNELMATQADALVAFWDGKSNGTRNMIEIARKAHLAIRVIRIGKTTPSSEGVSFADKEMPKVVKTADKLTFFYDHPDCKIDPSRLALYKKCFVPDAVFADIVSIWNARHKAEARKMSYNEKVELARAELRPYRAFLITNESVDQSDLVDNYTEDSVIVMLKADYTFVNMTPDEYLGYQWNKLAGNRARYNHDEDWLYQFRLDTSEFDLTTDPVSFEEPDRLEFMFDTKFRDHEYSINVDHFDANKVEEVIQFHGYSKGARAKSDRTLWSQEYVDQLLETRDAWANWIQNLLDNGEYAKAEEVRKLHTVMNPKVCPVCGHVYSNDRATCPICHEKNETYHGTTENWDFEKFSDDDRYNHFKAFGKSSFDYDECYDDADSDGLLDPCLVSSEEEWE